MWQKKKIQTYPTSLVQLTSTENSKFTNEIKADPIELNKKVEPKDEVMNVELWNGLWMVEKRIFPM